MPTDYVSNRYMSKLGMPAQQVTWDDDLDFDEVAKFFAMPVNDAANILGVCVSTLKRICKDNGLSRWPYRKFVAGRTVEEIKREAALAKSLAEQQQQYSSNHVSNSGHYAQASSSYSSHHHHYQQQQQQQQQMQHHHHHQYSSQVQSRPIHKGRFSTTATYRTKMPIPCFLDEFRYGHPPLASMEISKWWGVSDEGEDLIPAPCDLIPSPAKMVQRLTYRRRHSYATKSNQTRIVKTPGGKLVFQNAKKRAQGPKCAITKKPLPGICHLRPVEYKRSRLARHRKTVNRAYGGSMSGGAVRERIIRAFLVEEQKIVKKVLKIQKSKEKLASKAQA